MTRRALFLALLLIGFAAIDPVVIVPAEAIDRKTGRPTDPSGPSGRLPGPGTGGGQTGGCSQSYCEGVMRELGWKCTSVGAVMSSGGYCECQCKDQNGAVTNSKTTSTQHQPAGGGGGSKP